MLLVATFYQLPPRVLPSIHAVEGGQPGLVHGNTDGSQDLGVMQVNTRWLHPLAAYIGTSEAAVRTRLLADSCFNIAAAGVILRTYLNEAHGDLMQAVGFYHSHTPALSLSYQSRVVSSAARLFNATPSRR